METVLYKETVLYSLPYPVRIEAKENLSGAVYFVNTNFSDLIVKLFFPEKELSELPDDSTNVFKKPNLSCSMERSNTTS